MSNILLSLLFSLLLTLVVEISFALLLKIRSLHDIFVIFLANIITNPIVNYCYRWAVLLFSGSILPLTIITLILEAGAVFAEFLIFRALLKEDHIEKLKLSFMLNCASFASGMIFTIVIRLVRYIN